MKIYLDNCCFNRPFDDQSQIVVHLETRAKLHIQEQIRKGLHDLVWSYMLDFEVSKNPYEAHKQAIAAWYDLAAVKIHKSNEDILGYAEQLEKIGLKKYDALHVACAAYAGCDYFITTDRKILNKAVSRVRVVNPIEFIRRGETDDED